MHRYWSLYRARNNTPIFSFLVYRNMVKGMEEAGVSSLPCVAHTLQLAVTESLLSQRSVTEALEVGRKILGPLKHSNLEYSWLQDIQTQHGQPMKILQQDMQTRWNSTLYMVQSLIEKKWAIGVYVSENELPATLSTSGIFWRRW